MATYRIEFVGGGDTNRSPLAMYCVDDNQALRLAIGVLGDHLGAEIWDGERKVGWVTVQ
jgi:hypothetical protein